MVTGPFKINGVPVKRCHFKYVIPTSTIVDMKGVDVSKVDDKVFAHEKKAKKSQEEKFFAADKAVVSSHAISQVYFRRRKLRMNARSCKRRLTTR